MTKPRGRGGVATVAERLAQWLPDVRLVPTGRAKTSSYAIPRLIQDGRRLVGTLRPGAVVHLHTSLRPRALARDGAMLVASRMTGCPTVLHIHGWDRRFVQRLPRWARWVLAGADVVLVVDPSLGDCLAGMGIANETIHNPSNPHHAAPRDATSDVVLFVGRLTVCKGLFDLVEAWTRVRRARPNARLRLAGEGPAGPAVRDALRSVGEAGSVQWMGWLHDAALARAYASARVVVLPSREEGAPLAVIDALASGVPVVATDTGRVSELVGDAGVVVPVGAPEALARGLVQLLVDPGRGNLGPARVAPCHPRVVSAQLHRRYRELGA